MRPYIHECVREFTLQLCQRQGWFLGKKLQDITEDGTHPFWINNLEYALLSYEYWRNKF